MFKMLISSLCLIILLGTSQSEELSADEILTLVMNQTYGLNHTFRLSIIKKQNSKPDKKQVINISFLWPKEGPYLRKSFVETLEPKNLKGVRFWEHSYKESRLSKRWITLPVTGKLKDVTDKKPNKNEFNHFASEDLDFKSSVIEFAKKNDFQILLVTLGKKGMSLFFDNQFINFPAIVKRVHDVSGAGDTVISVFALFDSVGLSPKTSALFSNIAASLVCEEVGVIPIRQSSLEKKIKELL